MNYPFEATSPQKVEQFNNILRTLGLPEVELTKQGSKMEERTCQDIALDSVRQGLFIVGSIDINGAVSFSTNPIVHNNAHAARAESKRLAAMNPGKAFIFVKLAGAELVPSARTISI